LIVPTTDARYRAELAASKKPLKLLHVGPEAVVVANDDLPARAPGGRKNALHSGGRQRHRSFAQHVDTGPERGQHVRLVQMVRCRYDNRINLIEIKQIIDVSEDITNAKTLGEGAGFRTVIVAQGYKRGATRF
jgi:hypothetical protein